MNISNTTNNKISVRGDKSHKNILKNFQYQEVKTTPVNKLAHRSTRKTRCDSIKTNFIRSVRIARALNVSDWPISNHVYPTIRFSRENDKYIIYRRRPPLYHIIYCGRDEKKNSRKIHTRWIKAKISNF